MTIRYKNQGFKQASTGKTTVLTCPTSATIIIKSMYVANNDASGGGYGNHVLTYTATGSTANRKRFEKTSAGLGNTDVLTVGGSNIALNSGTIKDTADGTTNASLVLSGVAFSRTVSS